MVAERSESDKPRCNLADTTGDCFRALLRIATTLDRNGQIERGSAFWRQAMRCKSYGEVLRLAREVVEVIA